MGIEALAASSALAVVAVANAVVRSLAALKRCCLCSSGSLKLRVGPAHPAFRDASNEPPDAFVAINSNPERPKT